MIPIGTILFAFNEYDNILFCDGRELPINEYKEFADFCIKQYGKANHFGGDGIKSIGLPDIQGCSIVVRDIENRTEETDNTKDNVNKDIKMTLDEAIKHAEEVAEEKEQDKAVRKLHLDNKNSHNNIVHYQKACKCAEEHRQLAEWLKDYKRMKEQEPKTGHWEWLTENKYRCSNCNHETRVDECFGKPMYDFCPFCRARMESEE